MEGLKKEFIENKKKEFSKLVDIASKNNFYSDIIYFSKTEKRITLDKNDIKIDETSDFGVKIRIWIGSYFLEFGSSNLEFDFLKNKMINLVEKAKKLYQEDKSKKNFEVDTELIDKNFEIEDNKKNNKLDLKEIIKKLKEIKNKTLSLDKEVVDVRTLLIEEDEENIFVNPYKKLYQKIPLKILIVAPFIKCKDSNVRNTYTSHTSNDYSVFEVFENNFEDFKKDSINIKNVKKLKGGKYKVLLSPKLTGLLAHESFGHGMEADTIRLGRALSSKWMGKKIAPDNVNIVDEPPIKGKYGEFFFDHEGNIAKKTYLVKNGIIQDPISDNYSKNRLNLKKKCFNCRFESFDHKSYVRMSNTYFERGEDEVNDLISRIEDGIFIKNSNGGMEDPKSWGVQIQGCFGQRIKNGKLIDEFYDGFTLTGFLPDIVGKISGISKEFEIDGAGHCGKGHKEWVRVSEGGPYLLIDEVILG